MSYSYLLGPNGENQSAFTDLLSRTVSEHFNWRRESANISLSANELFRRQGNAEMNQSEIITDFLSKMTDSVPFASPRYLGHMNSDLSLYGLIGYISGLLYNQNNVARESSPVTTAWESQTIKKYLQMIGYDTRTGGGYITSGGTTANIQALLVARNLKFWPLSLSILLRQQKHLYDRLREHNIFEDYLNSTCFEIMKLSPDTILKLHADFLSVTDSNSLKGYSIQELGVVKFFHLLQDTFPAERNEKYLNGGIRIAVADNHHYSMQKASDILGLGSDALLKVELNKDFGMNTDCFCSMVDRLDNNKEILMATVSIVGSTEQGSIDSIHEIVDTVDSSGAYWHIDAAYGGYFFSALRDNSDQLNTADMKHFYLNELRDTVNIDEFSALFDQLNFDNMRTKLEAVQYSHSLTVDPHKLGYIPYSAGMLLLRNQRMFDFVQYDAAYLWRNDTSYMGRYTLEGSRSGATAGALFLSSQMMPLNRTGHGQLVIASMLASAKLNELFSDTMRESVDIRVINNPETNILNYFVYSPFVSSLRELRTINQELLDNHLWPTSENSLFMVVSTEYKVRDIKNLLSDSYIDFDLDDDDDFTVLRSVIMSPFLLTARNAESGKLILEEFVEYLLESAETVLSSRHSINSVEILQQSA